MGPEISVSIRSLWLRHRRKTWLCKLSIPAFPQELKNCFGPGKCRPSQAWVIPLVPGYEATGEVVEAPQSSAFKAGDTVFVPGANCYDGAFGLFGGAARYLVSNEDRVTKLDGAMGAEGALLALAATARHAMAGPGKSVPDLIIGHGVLGRLLARLTVAAGAPPPTVWEIDPARRYGRQGL